VTGLQAWVDGKPRPKGSLKVTGRPGQKARVVEDNPALEGWRAAIVFKLNPIRAAHPDDFPIVAPVAVTAEFVFLAPKKARPGDRPDTTYTGDTDKLARCVGDCLQDAKILGNDSQIVEWRARSWYGVRQGLWLRVTTDLDDTPPWALRRVVGVGPGQ
jgi:Holliday junction resolvase RusA-like endonuclease